MSYVGTILSGIADRFVREDKVISLDCSMRIEHEGVRLNVKSRGKKLILSFESLRDFLQFMKLKSKNRAAINTFYQLSDNLLNTLGLNLCLFNSSLCIIGPRAGYVLPKLLGIKKQ